MQRRQHPRQSVRRPGKLLLGGRGDVPCCIRDVSIGGARLDVPDARVVGYGIDLRDVMTGALRRCSVAWREGTAIGVRFIDAGEWPNMAQLGTSPTFGRRTRSA